MQPPTSLSAAGDTVFCVKGNLRDEGSNCGLKLLLSYQGMEEEQSVAFPNKSTATPRLLLFPPGIMGRREGGIGGGEDDSADIKNKLYKRPLPLRRRSGYIGAKNTRFFKSLIFHPKFRLQNVSKKAGKWKVL